MLDEIINYVQSLQRQVEVNELFISPIKFHKRVFKFKLLVALFNNSKLSF